MHAIELESSLSIYFAITMYVHLHLSSSTGEIIHACGPHLVNCPLARDGIITVLTAMIASQTAQLANLTPPLSTA